MQQLDAEEDKDDTAGSYAELMAALAQKVRSTAPHPHFPYPYPYPYSYPYPTPNPNRKPKPNPEPKPNPNQVGRRIGAEAAARGVSVVLGPGVNIKRSPLCGRNFEYFSEDPHLSAELAAAWIEGVQSKGVGASLKHLIANEQEWQRMVVDTLVDERTPTRTRTLT